MAADLHGMVCKEGKHSNIIDVVFDTYQTIYIKKRWKDTKRRRRSAAAQYHIYSAD